PPEAEWRVRLQYPSLSLEDASHERLAPAVRRVAARRPRDQTAWQSWRAACDVDERPGPSTISAAAPRRGTRARRDARPRREYGDRLPVTAHAAPAQRLPSSGGWALGQETAPSASPHVPATLTMA